MAPKDKLRLNKKDTAFFLPLEIRETLEQTQAKDYLLSLDTDWKRFRLISHDSSEGWVEPNVLYHPGVVTCSGDHRWNEKT